MQYCVSRDNALRGGASAVLRITGQCPEEGPVQYCVSRDNALRGGAVQYCVSRDNALRGGQCSMAYHGTMP